MVWDHNAQVVVSLRGTPAGQVRNCGTPRAPIQDVAALMSLADFLCCQQEEEEGEGGGEGPELGDMWPRKGQRISFETFTVSLRSENQVCLANEDMLAVRDYVLESTQVRNTCS